MDNELRNEQLTSPFVGSFLLWAISVFDLLLKVSGNAEADVLNALKNNLVDPNNVLQSWDRTQANPCMWFRVTCNSDNRVTRVDLGDENLSGQLVPQLGQLPNLQYLELYSNTISGKIPDELGNLTNLVSLDLYLNGLTGHIPDTFGNLKNLRFLRLNNNSLSGNIPLSLTTVASLKVLDISNNQLEGDVPVSGSFRSIPIVRFQNNPGLKQQEFSPPPISPRLPALSGNNATTIIAGGVAAGTTALWFAAYAIAFVYWRRRKLQDHYYDVPDEEEFNKIPREQLKHFSLFDLQVATDNFSSQNRVGRGGSGMVYKGCLADGSLVAVKRIERGQTEHLDQQFRTEMKMISMAVHRNLLRLNGFCITPTEWLLVYPFMTNRSLDWFLRDRPESQPPLDWPIRKCIALGAARGLAYLHDHCDLKIIHRDFKASNILLDKKFEAVIGDFGLAKLICHNDTHITTRVHGTLGHIAPEYILTGRLTEKADVFGYGVMLLELITGRRAYELADFASKNKVLMFDWVKGHVRDGRLETLVDADLRGNHNAEEVELLIQVSLLCSQHNHLRRPKMSEVVSMLEGDDFSEKWEQYFHNGLFLEDFDSSTSDDQNNWESQSFIPSCELSGPR